MAIIMTDVDPEEKVSFYPKEMEELFDLDRCRLREGTPKEAYEALEKLKQMSIELGQ